MLKKFLYAFVGLICSGGVLAAPAESIGIEDSSLASVPRVIHKTHTAQFSYLQGSSRANPCQTFVVGLEDSKALLSGDVAAFVKTDGFKALAQAISAGKATSILFKFPGDQSFLCEVRPAVAHEKDPKSVVVTEVIIYGMQKTVPSFVLEIVKKSTEQGSFSLSAKIAGAAGAVAVGGALVAAGMSASTTEVLVGPAPSPVQRISPLETRGLAGAAPVPVPLVGPALAPAPDADPAAVLASDLPDDVAVVALPRAAVIQAEDAKRSACFASKVILASSAEASLLTRNPTSVPHGGAGLGAVPDDLSVVPLRDRPKVFDFVLASREKGTKLKEFISRIKASQDREAEALRKFIVEADSSGNSWQRLAFFISQMSSLSVQHFKHCEAEGLRLLQKLPTDPREKHILTALRDLVKVLQKFIISQLPKGAKCLADNDTGCFVFSFSLLSIDKFILKVQNPYAYAFSRWQRENNGSIKNQNVRKNSVSTRRHARRVLVADFVNREFKDVGFHAPEKKLCLRQGAFKEGLIDDGFVVVIEEFLDQSACLPGSPSFTHEQLRAMARVMSFAQTSDLHEIGSRRNIFRIASSDPSGRRECDVAFVDLEAPFYKGRYTMYDAFGERKLHFSDYYEYEKAAIQDLQHRNKVNLTLKVRANERDNYLLDRVATLCNLYEIEKSVAEEDSQIKNFRCICIQRQNLRLYLSNLEEKGFLRAEESARVKHFWMGDDIEHGFLSASSHPARKKYLAGNLAECSWQRINYQNGAALRAYELDVFLPEQPDPAVFKAPIFGFGLGSAHGILRKNHV